MSSIGIKGDLLTGLTFFMFDMRQNWRLHGPQKKPREVRKGLTL